MFQKYELDWIKIVDLLLRAKFLAKANNFWTPSSLIYYIIISVSSSIIYTYIS